MGLFDKLFKKDNNIKNIKFNNETLRKAVKEWLEDDKKAKASYGHISNWDTSEVTDMSDMFEYAEKFNEPIGDWDVSSVTNMRRMFAGSYDSPSIFNQPIGDWDVSNVVDIRGMFFSTDAFNQSIGNWDVSKVTDMSSMFYGATVFNQPIGDWDVSNVTNMYSMFAHATSFNQPIGDWYVSNVSNIRIRHSGKYPPIHLGMSFMFSGAKAFNQPIGNWDVSKVTDMSFMFEDAKSFNQSIENWDVSSVTDMESLFCDAAAFNQDIGNWDLVRLPNMKGMFVKTGLIEKYGINGELFKNNKVKEKEVDIDTGIYLQQEGTTFYYTNENHEDFHFIANQLLVCVPEEEGAEFVVHDKIREALDTEHVIFVSKGLENFRLIDLPEIDDEEFYNSVGDLSDIKKPLKSTEEAIDFVKNLPTISFNNIMSKEYVNNNIRYIR